MRRFATLAVATAAATMMLAVLSESDAAAQPPKAEDIADGPFVYAAPGGFAIPFGFGGKAGYADNYIDFSYQTQFGGGYLIERNGFMATFGAEMEFVLYDIDRRGGWRGDADGFMVRLLPEIRLGAGSEWFFIYGNIKPGFAISHVDWRWGDCDGWNGKGPFKCDPDDRYDQTQAGFNLGHSGGAIFKIYKGLGVGTEIGFDHTFFGDPDPFEQIWMMDWILFAGWWF